MADRVIRHQLGPLQELQQAENKGQGLAPGESLQLRRGAVCRFRDDDKVVEASASGKITSPNKMVEDADLRRARQQGHTPHVGPLHNAYLVQILLSPLYKGVNDFTFFVGT